MIKKILYIGHRGTRTTYDENTLEAFEIAYKSGAEIVELDLRLSKDNKLVVFHDKEIDRITNSSGVLKQIKYSELLRYRTNRRNSVIPLINNVFDMFNAPKRFMIELKDNNVKNQLTDLIIRRKIGNRVIFSGRDFNSLRNLKQEVPDCLVCYNITKGRGFSLKQLLKDEDNHPMELKSNFDMISLKSSLINFQFIEKCHKYQKKALAWDFISYKNPIIKIKELITLGIDGILFDDHRNIAIIKSWLED